MKFFTSLKSDEEKLAEKQRALDVEQAEFQRRQNLVVRRDHLLNQLDAAKAEFARQYALLEKNFDYSAEAFARDFINHGLKAENILRLKAPDVLKSCLPAIKVELEKLIVEPRQIALDNFLSENKSELGKLPKPVKQPEPPFEPKKLAPDFYTSGESAKLTASFQ